MGKFYIADFAVCINGKFEFAYKTLLNYKSGALHLNAHRDF